MLNILHLESLWKSSPTGNYPEYKIKAHTTIVFNQNNVNNIRQNGMW